MLKRFLSENEYIQAVEGYNIDTPFRFERAVRTQREFMDPGIIPIVEKLNKIPGLVTTESCEGHVDREKFTVSVFFLVTEQGYDHVLDIFERASIRMIDEIPTPAWSGGRYNCLSTAFVKQSNRHSKSYVIHYMTFRFKSEESRLEVLRILEESVDDALLRIAGRPL